MTAVRIPGRRLLISPGPTPIPDEVLHACSQQPLDHGDPRLDELIAACESGLRRVLGTASAEVFMFSSNGHGAWESVIENLAAPGEAVLVPGTGHFSEQWALQTEALGRRVVRTPWREGHAIDPAAGGEQALRDDPAHGIRAVFAVHTDTSSGITSDLAALRAVLDRHRAATRRCWWPTWWPRWARRPSTMDAGRIDVALGASQKGLMCPPGAGLVAVECPRLGGGAAPTRRRATTGTGCAAAAS